jgi:hypothetical protein
MFNPGLRPTDLFASTERGGYSADVFASTERGGYSAALSSYGCELRAEFVALEVVTFTCARCLSLDVNICSARN